MGLDICCGKKVYKKSKRSGGISRMGMIPTVLEKMAISARRMQDLFL